MNLTYVCMYICISVSHAVLAFSLRAPCSVERGVEEREAQKSRLTRLVDHAKKSGQHCSKARQHESIFPSFLGQI